MSDLHSKQNSETTQQAHCNALVSVYKINSLYALALVHRPPFVRIDFHVDFILYPWTLYYALSAGWYYMIICLLRLHCAFIRDDDDSFRVKRRRVNNKLFSFFNFFFMSTLFTLSLILFHPLDCSSLSLSFTLPCTSKGDRVINKS